MEQYRVYDRQSLEYVDGGVMKNYSVDLDYISDNSSTVTLAEETYAKKGDIIARISGKGKIFLGCITAVDNTKLTISFKNMKELFSDTVLNVFKYTDTAGYKFEAVGTIKLILTLAFIDMDDIKKKLPLKIETYGTAPSAVWSDEGDTLSIKDFLAEMFDSHNIYLDFDIDFKANKIVCKIIKNTSGGYVIKDNIKLSEPTFDKNELPSYNKAVVYDEESGTILGTYYLLADNTVTEDADDENRLLPVQTKYISYEEDKGYTPMEAAASELSGNIYDHCARPDRALLKVV